MIGSRTIWALAGLAPLAMLGAVALQPARAQEAQPSGQALFTRECGLCHRGGGTGTMMLARRLGADKSLLEERTDLTPSYVEFAVRRGINSMPTITRVEVTDAELAQIIEYLVKEGGQ